MPIGLFKKPAAHKSSEEAGSGGGGQLINYNQLAGHSHHFQSSQRPLKESVLGGSSNRHARFFGKELHTVKDLPGGFYFFLTGEH